MFDGSHPGHVRSIGIERERKPGHREKMVRASGRRATVRDCGGQNAHPNPQEGVESDPVKWADLRVAGLQ